MEKFIKENWFKILIILILSGGFCIYYFSYFLPHKNQTVLLDLQQKCANQAQNFYTSKGYKDSDGFSFTNHFNLKLNKCFILVNSYDINKDFLTIDLYGVLEGKHYAMFIGHNNCDATSLQILNDSKKCQLDSGSIWFDGNDTRNPADYHVGFQGYTVGSGIGDENTQKQFLEKVQTFMSN